MKPLVYLTALRLGLSLDSPVLDAPIWLPMGRGRPAKQVANYDGVFKGPITLRRALAESRNAATVRLAGLVGIPAIVRRRTSSASTPSSRPYLTTALGASDVTLLELANVYRTLASGRACRALDPAWRARARRLVAVRRGPGPRRGRSTTRRCP